MKICPVCGKEFEQNSNIQKYCSTNCRRKANRNNERVIKYNKGTAPIEDKIVAAYHGECAICGWKIANGLVADKKGRVKWKYGNEIHHIVMAEDGGDDGAENRILLCPNHHAQANAGLITPEELRKHQKPVPLPPEQVRKDKDNIEQAVEEFTDREEGKLTPEACRFLTALDLAVILGRAGLIDGYLDKNYLVYVPAADLTREKAQIAREQATIDKESNEYEVRDWNWYERILGDEK